MSDRADKIIDLIDKRLNFVVSATEYGPVFIVVASILRLAPTNVERSVAAVQVDKVRLVLIDAPGEIDIAHHSFNAAYKDLHGVFDLHVLDSFSFDDLQVNQRSKQKTHDVNTVRAVVNQNTAT